MIQQPIPANYPEMTELWEASVRASHHFLTEEDIERIKPMLFKIFDSLDVYIIRADNKIAGMMGLTRDEIAMLFLHPDAFGKGIGKQLVNYAITEHGAQKVEVNEQNPQAVSFYQHMGFKITGRRETDDYGQAFPILEMEME